MCWVMIFYNLLAELRPVPGANPFLFCSASREVAEVKWIIEIEVYPICGWSPRKDILIDIKSISLSVV